MNEYINKNKFLEQLRQELSEIDTVHHDHIILEKRMYEFFISKVEEVESEDVEPVKHFGCWFSYGAFGYKQDENGVKKLYYRCSNCYKGNVSKSKYCPNCGAKMQSSRNGIGIIQTM